ncbi:MAG: iron export ABC transporter permease subunit FetB [Candidatus Methanofastidiosa archaeon]|nr:iron export ABC transporter permease subunit FetB [Candidatus Methanofastidiosa archaeon]
MATDIVDISLVGLVMTYTMYSVVVAAVHLRGMGIARDMVYGMVRMTVQLVAAGVVLEYVFSVDRWYLVVVILVYFLLMASRIVFRRVGGRSRALQRNVVAAIAAGGGTVLAVFMLFTTGHATILDPRYAIPLGGMIIGNAMSGCALAYERYHAAVQKGARQIETLLSMGATSGEASSAMVRESIKAAFLPQILTMTAMGLVMLPGMMTGQILSGTLPLVAIKYQVAIMLAIVSSNAVVATVIVMLESRQIFNRYHQFMAVPYEKSFKTKQKRT